MTKAPRQPMIVIDTIAKSHAYECEIRAYCPNCGHSHQLDLGAIVAKAGDMTPDTLRCRLRCGKCGRLGGWN